MSGSHAIKNSLGNKQWSDAVYCIYFTKSNTLPSWGLRSILVAIYCSGKCLIYLVVVCFTWYVLGRRDFAIVDVPCQHCNPATLVFSLIVVSTPASSTTYSSRSTYYPIKCRAVDIKYENTPAMNTQ